MFESKQARLYAGGITLVLVAAVFMGMRGRPEAGEKEEKEKAITVTQRTPRQSMERNSSPAPLTKGRRYYPELADSSWKKMAATLTPQQAKDLLENDRLNEKNIDTRAERAWHIINQLCLNGHSREAWELIETETGTVREKALGGFFRDADLPEVELIAMMNGLTNRDKASSFYNYFSRLTPEEFAKGVDLSQFPMGSTMEMFSLRRAMEDMMVEAYDAKDPEASKEVRRDLLAKVLEQSNNGTISYQEFKNFLSKDPSKDGFTYWEVLKSATPEIRADQLQGTRNYDGTDAMVIRAMTIQDPAKTMAMTLVTDSHEANYIHIAMGQWLEKDFTNAKTWVDGHQASFTPEQQERMAVAFVRAQVARGEYDSAAEWAAKIQSPKWKGAVAWHEGQIRRNRPETVPAN